MTSPVLSLIVPSRGRPARLRSLLASIAATARRLQQLEVVLVLDADDAVSHAVNEPRLNVRRVVGEPGRTMGALNAAGYAVASGELLMLLNDDVIVRTPRWDAVVRRCLRRFPDPYVLVHVNDTLMQRNLCVFPIVSRAYCELAGGICPTSYRRYRIDDHIEDPFNMLAAVGVPRCVYLPDVIFEHDNAATHPTAGRIYLSDPAILAEDAPRFDALFPQRKELALRMLAAIGADTPERLAAITGFRDPFALRMEHRQIVERSMWNRVRAQYHMNGYRGVIRAATRQFV